MSDGTKTSALTLPAAGCCGARIDRRRVIQGLIGAAGLVAAGPALAEKPEEMAPQEGDFLVSALGKNPLTPDNIRVNAGPLEAWAMSPDGVARRAHSENQLALYRFDPATLPPEIAAKAPRGVVALTATCTHSGCPVTEYAPATGILTCLCHGSQFSPKEGGKLVHGPAMRKLPQLVIALKDDKLVVAGGFDGRVGGDFPMTDDH